MTAAELAEHIAHYPKVRLCQRLDGNNDSDTIANPSSAQVPAVRLFISPYASTTRKAARLNPEQ